VLLHFCVGRGETCWGSGDAREPWEADLAPSPWGVPSPCVSPAWVLGICVRGGEGTESNFYKKWERRVMSVAKISSSVSGLMQNRM